MINQESYQKLKLKVLKELWGYDAFRDLQESIIDNLMDGFDTVALLPTGGGKSICYQLACILQPSTQS